MEEDSQNKLRVVVTGMGVVSPVGVGVSSFWEALLRGDCGIRPLRNFDTTGFPYTSGGEIPAEWLKDDPPEIAAADRGTRFMLRAAIEAATQAGLATPPDDPSSFGVVLSTNFGGLFSGEAALRHMVTCRSVERHAFEALGFQTAADQVARALGATGPRVNLSLSCASGTAALGYAMQWLRASRATYVLAGGYDALAPVAWSGLSALRTMTTDRVRPFDRRRNGTIFSEGAGALVLELEASARRRGAPVLAEVVGCGLTNNAFHLTAPDKEGEGLAEAMRAALADAGVQAHDVEHVNAHGTGTRYNDLTETLAIKAVLGRHARDVPVTSIKGSVGHMMGAAGSAEAIASVMSLQTGVLPPTLHYEEPDPDCDLDYVLQPRHVPRLRVVVSNSAGIGGCNAVVVLRRVGL